MIYVMYMLILSVLQRNFCRDDSDRDVEGEVIEHVH